MHRDSGWADSTKNLKATFDNNIRLLTESYIKALEDSINSIILTEESLTHLQDQIAKQITENIKVTQVDVDKRETILRLDEAYKLVLEQISSELHDSLSFWRPNVAINEVIDGDKISNKLTELVNEAIEYRVQDWIDNIKYDDYTSEVSVIDNYKHQFKVIEQFWDKIYVTDQVELILRIDIRN